MTVQTSVQPEQEAGKENRLPAYQSLLLATDSSDHANRGAQEAVALAQAYSAKVTGVHIYAAKMHDARFRQMEGGLPEQFRAEQELERQRDVHDDLITRGLSIISDSYLDYAERTCSGAEVPFARRSLEGKNYRQLVNETNSGSYDLLVIGALGLGAVHGSRIGTVCQRVVRRAEIDTLVIKNPNRPVAEGPIVVAVDGSPHSYGGLLTALSLAQQWQTQVTVVAAFDPYYHYVAFNRIAGVLSEEAGKVFRFKEQEKLHEDIIDRGLAKIYKGHLEVAETIARDHGMEVETALLSGKPHDAISKFLCKTKPSLLVLGKVGIHADPDLDIGGNTENLLIDADCAVLLSQSTYRPRVEVVADLTIAWTTEAEQRMSKVPSFVQNMARMAILRYAQERGHTVITERLVEEATAQLMPAHAESVMGEIVTAYEAGQIGTARDHSPAIGQAMVWSDAAHKLLSTVDDLAVRKNLRMRAEKKARTEGQSRVEAQHIQGFLHGAGKGATSEMGPGSSPQKPLFEADPVHWQAAALARLMRVPAGFMRDGAKERIETYARANAISEISLEAAEAGLAGAHQAMAAAMRDDAPSASVGTTPLPRPGPGPGQSKCPFAHVGGGVKQQIEVASSSAQTVIECAPGWTSEAAAELERVPPGFCRDMTRKAAETMARQNGAGAIDIRFVQKIMQTFATSAATVNETMPWASTARARIARAPETIRGMLVKEIEAWAQRHGLDRVGEDAVQAVKNEWAQQGQFHLGSDDPRRNA